MSLPDPEQRRRARVAAHYLEFGFAWRDTPQGYDHWQAIWEQLRELGTEPEVVTWLPGAEERP